MKSLIAFIAFFSCISFPHTTSGQKPAARWTHSMCFDRANKTLLMFGGSGNDGYFGDLWGFSKGSWKKLSEAGPAPRNKFAFAYDEKRQRTVLFGGSGANDELFSDTWEWDGRAWTKIDIAGPAKRDHPLGAYDPQRQTIIIKGGFNSSGLLTDTWSYDGTKWTHLTDAGTAGKGLAHGMFVDESAKRLILITVEMNDQNQERLCNTWWVLNKNKWESSGKEFPSTSKQCIQAISAYGNGGIVVLDGDDIKNNNATTAWFSNGNWTRQNMNGPQPRVGHAMIWDPVEGIVLLFGGFDRKNFFDDTWVWQNEKWAKR